MTFGNIYPDGYIQVVNEQGQELFRACDVVQAKYIIDLIKRGISVVATPDSSKVESSEHN